MAEGPNPFMVDFSQLDGQRKAKHVYCGLKQKIVLGEIGPGASIIEQAVAQEFSCSQGTVREALLSLQQDGLVNRNGYQGTEVTQTSTEEARLLTHFRLELETKAFSAACGRLTEDMRTYLHKAAHEISRHFSESNLFALTEIDRSFHLCVFSLSGMPNLLPILTRVLLLLHRHQIIHFLKIGESFEGMAPIPHTDLIKCLEHGTQEDCSRALIEHVELNKKLWHSEI